MSSMCLFLKLSVITAFSVSFDLNWKILYPSKKKYVSKEKFVDSTLLKTCDELVTSHNFQIFPR